MVHSSWFIVDGGVKKMNDDIPVKGCPIEAAP